jgi:hypothetical protein
MLQVVKIDDSLMPLTLILDRNARKQSSPSQNFYGFVLLGGSAIFPFTARTQLNLAQPATMFSEEIKSNS